MKVRLPIRLDVAVAIILTGALTYDLALRRPAVLGATGAKVVSAQEYQVLGPGGEMRARLTTAKDRPTLVFYDSDAKTPRVIIAMTPSGDPMVSLLDRDGRTPRLVADVTGGSSSSPSKAGAHIYDSSGKAVWSAP